MEHRFLRTKVVERKEGATIYAVRDDGALFYAFVRKENRKQLRAHLDHYLNDEVPEEFGRVDLAHCRGFPGWVEETSAISS